MSRHVIILLILAVLTSACCRNAERNAMKRLAETIQNKEHYNKTFIDKTGILGNQFSLSVSNDRKWEIADRLHKEYLSYDIDSAMVWSDMLDRLADTPQKRLRAIEANVACLCALRKYSTIETILVEIDTTGFDHAQLYSYYQAHISLYTSLGNEFGTDEKQAKEHLQNRYRYQELLLQLPTLDKTEREYLKGKQMMLEERFDEALETLLSVLDHQEEISAKLHTTYAIANCYKAKGDRSNYKRWLAQTAIYDLQRPNRQYRSLYDLALCLYEDGDYTQAGELIQMTVIDAIACKHNTRIFNAVEAQMIISAAHEVNSRNEKWMLSFFTSLMIVAVIIISAALAKVNRQRKRLKTLMKQANEFNRELSKKNGIISEANVLKEKYMFKYMYLSANFIKEIDEYRKELRHTYKESGIEALMAKLREPEYIYMQYKSFYRLFDEIFLGIFPDFPDKVNSLLKEDKQISMKHKGVLPTELRILAVIRLGMKESRKIAEFLNTSVNTVYTYRTKMRYDSINGPELFEEKIKNIDYFKI